METANDDQLDAALEQVDGVMDRMMERARELGVPVGAGLNAEDGHDLSLVDDSDRGPNAYLQELADMLKEGTLSDEQEEVV